MTGEAEPDIRPLLEASHLHDGLLDGLRVLVLEDEFLIAMDVEQTCRDHGASDVVIAKHVEALGPDPFAGEPVDAAILDIRLGAGTTLDFAWQLHLRGIPFIFATGYVDDEGLFAHTERDFGDVPVLMKPYTSTELIDALARAINSVSASRS